MSLTFTMDDVREHCSPPTNGWLPGADSIKMADEIDRLRMELEAAKFATAHAKHDGWDDADAAQRGYGALLVERDAEIDRLRAELAQMTELMQKYYIDWDNADEALARVRELCDVAHADCQEEFIPAMDGYVLFLKVDDVLRSLDGAE